MFVVVVDDGTVTVVVVVIFAVPATVVFFVVVVFGVVVVVPTTEVVEVFGARDRQLQALDRVGPDGYRVRAAGSGTVAAAALFLFAAGHVLTVAVEMPFVTVLVDVVVLMQILDFGS